MGNQDTQPAQVSAFVLAGGQSRRMGQDKTLLNLAGKPLISHALSILREAGLSPVIAGSHSDLSAYAPVISDPQPDLGPLSGICAALNTTPAPFSVFVPVDLPLLPASLLGYLIHRAQVSDAAVTLPSICGSTNTFPVVLSKSTLPTLQQELKSGRRGCSAAFQVAATALGQAVSAVPVELLAQSGHAWHPLGIPAAFWLMNINFPADLDRASRHFAPQIA
jgi:molybdenum cofactor guanylyltransferase